MSGILKNLKSLFIEDDPKAAKTNEKSAPAEETSKAKPAAEVKIDFSTVPSEPGEPKTKFNKILLQVIEKHNLAGFDYLEYKNGLRSLDNMEMDEATRFKSAYAMAQTMGVTKSKLLESAKHYQSVLNTEKEQFEKAAEQQMKVKVVGRKEELKAWESEIKAKETQIAKLEKEIETLKQKVLKVSGSLDAEASKVKKTKLDFEASYAHIYGQIQEDIDKMNQYLT